MFLDDVRVYAQKNYSSVKKIKEMALSMFSLIPQDGVLCAKNSLQCQETISENTYFDIIINIKLIRNEILDIMYLDTINLLCVHTYYLDYNFNLCTYLIIKCQTKLFTQEF